MLTHEGAEVGNNHSVSLWVSQIMGSGGGPQVALEKRELGLKGAKRDVVQAISGAILHP